MDQKRPVVTISNHDWIFSGEWLACRRQAIFCGRSPGLSDHRCCASDIEESSGSQFASVDPGLCVLRTPRRSPFSFLGTRYDSGMRHLVWKGHSLLRQTRQNSRPNAVGFSARQCLGRSNALRERPGTTSRQGYDFKSLMADAIHPAAGLLFARRRGSDPVSHGRFFELLGDVEGITWMR